MEIANCLTFTNICFWNIFTLIFSLIGCVSGCVVCSPCSGLLANILCGQTAAIGETTCDFVIHYLTDVDVQEAYRAGWFEQLIKAATNLIVMLTGGSMGTGGEATGGYIGEEIASYVAKDITEFLKVICVEIFGNIFE